MIEEATFQQLTKWRQFLNDLVENGEMTSEGRIDLGWKIGEMQMLPVTSLFCGPLVYHLLFHNGVHGWEMEIRYSGRHTIASSTEQSNTTRLQFCQYQLAIREDFSILNVSKVEPRLSGPLSAEVSVNAAGTRNHFELCFLFFNWNFAEKFVKVDIGAYFRHTKACKILLSRVDLL
ncbi:hypothetical protein AVEN_109280-1 [Araneus ventricosus]|uniref:Uncharacterized protein n=1 Tax=Araneus ventricosus TaxID=182803 RepID=A0A4Y2QZW9_ARAVE|nr:hypothetical protein AVEN_109280-1 [Araneus ventricosus]